MPLSSLSLTIAFIRIHVSFTNTPTDIGIRSQKEKKLSGYQVVSIAKQVAFALAVAEAAYEFEHRDLHNSNILIKKTSDRYVLFALNGRAYRMECCGVLAFLIDNTFSRYKISECFFTPTAVAASRVSPFRSRVQACAAACLLVQLLLLLRMNDSRDNPSIECEITNK